MSEFLSLLLTFTFQQPTFEGQLVCLELWLQLISYLSSRIQDRAVHRDVILEQYNDQHSLFCVNVNLQTFRYRGALMHLLSHVVTIIQFKHNQAKLEELDDETMDSDVSVEIVCKYP
jgi:hypothetical protein